MKANKLKIPKYIFFEPINNLKGKASSYVTEETKFTIQFAKAYISQLKSIHSNSKKQSISCAREIPINGFGIADLVTIAWDSNNFKPLERTNNIESFINNANPTIRAFEMKLNNWRKCMTQANRYRYFSNTAIAVLPLNKCPSALEYIETFKKISIGLWGFSPETNKIVPYFTPKISNPLIPKYYNKTIELVKSASRSLPIA